MPQEGVSSNETWERPRRFQTAAEAVAWTQASLSLGAVKGGATKDSTLPWEKQEVDTASPSVASSGRLPWETGAANDVPKARNSFTLALMYIDRNVDVDSEIEKDLSLNTWRELKIQFHAGFNIPEDAPDDIKRRAESVKNGAEYIGKAIAKLLVIKGQLTKETHPLHDEMKAAEKANDFKFAEIKNTEISRLKNEVDSRLKGLQKTIDLLQDREKWEATLMDKAALVKRHDELLKIVKQPYPENVSQDDKDRFTIVKAEASRELEALMQKQNKVAPGNDDIRLYLYHHPETAPDTRFTPVD